MFQSSSTASGSRFWHALSASSPSSASEISKSSPSRMRRATLRITLESSTTRHVFMTHRPLLSRRARTSPSLSHLEHAAFATGSRSILRMSSPANHFAGTWLHSLAHVLVGEPYRLRRDMCCGLRRHRLADAVEDAIDVEHHQQLLLQPVHARRHTGEMRIEVDWTWLARVLGELEHLADRVDEEAVGFSVKLDADRHCRFLGRALAQPEPAMHVDRGDDAAAQVEHARDLGRSERHARHAFR